MFKKMNLKLCRQMAQAPLLYRPLGEKVFIVDMKERLARGICKFPEQREKESDRTWPADWPGQSYPWEREL